MLVLTRKVQESVAVGDAAGLRCRLKVTVLEVAGTKVRLGFEADGDVFIHRWEVWEQVCAARPDVPAAAAIPVP